MDVWIVGHGLRSEFAFDDEGGVKKDGGSEGCMSSRMRERV